MTSAPSIFLVDTNVLVYMYDQNEPAKRARAIALYERLLDLGIGALSVQVLSEFFTATTRRLKPRLPIADAIEAVSDLCRAWRVLELQPQQVLDAIRAVEAYKLPYFDALVWATARQHGIPFLLSEDFNSGQLIEGVRFVNPFAADFDLSILS
jgi:predicted nucleic acid-binding protein